MDQNVKLVNRLVKNAFGNSFSGDYDVTSTSLDQTMQRREELGRIMRRTWLPIPFIWEFFEDIGRFTSKDGSSLKVRISYLPRAEKYAELYKRQFGKTVQIQMFKDNDRF
jgi:hypothetical protein